MTNNILFCPQRLPSFACPTHLFIIQFSASLRLWIIAKNSIGKINSGSRNLYNITSSFGGGSVSTTYAMSVIQRLQCTYYLEVDDSCTIIGQDFTALPSIIFSYYTRIDYLPKPPIFQPWGIRPKLCQLAPNWISSNILSWYRSSSIAILHTYV